MSLLIAIAMMIPQTAQDSTTKVEKKKLETATFAVGWFWGPDAQFGGLKGVVRTRVGYSGGTKKNPTYRDLGDHTETFEVDFDPDVITYEKLLDKFWASHSPTYSSGSTQYKAAVYYRSDAQKKAAELSREKLSLRLKKKVHTEILKGGTFWRAEDYHQKYRLRAASPILKEFEALFPTTEAFLASTAVTRANAFLAGYGTTDQRRNELPQLGLSESAQASMRPRWDSMIEVDSSLPEMSATSDVEPTVRTSHRTLVLAYHLAMDEASAVVRFDDVREWHYGYPNDDGLDSHPSWGHGLMHYAFHVTPVASHGERAWIGTFHDGTLTVYAGSVEVLVHERAGTPGRAIVTTLGEGEARNLDAG